MTLEEFKKQGYQLIQYAKITEERSIDLSDYDPMNYHGLKSMVSRNNG